MLRRSSPLYIKMDFDFSKLVWLLKFSAKCNPAHLKRALRAREKITALSKQLYAELFSQEPTACDWQKRGVLMVYKSQAAMAQYEKTNALLKPYGHAAKPLSATDLLKMEPALHPDVCGGWYHETDSHLRPEKLLHDLKKALLFRGAVITENCALAEFALSGNQIVSADTAKGRVAARHYVMAAGAWAPQVARQIPVPIPVQPGKGYSITMGRPQSCPRIPCYFYEPRVVATPWQDGLRLGGTMEFSGFNTKIDPLRIANLKQAANDYLRQSPGRPVMEEWVGLRPMSCDDLPIIGPVSPGSNLLLATGHGMMGLTMATGTGRLVADLICEEKPAFDPQPFSPSRF